MTENQTMDVVPVCNGLSWLVEDIGGKLEEFIWLELVVMVVGNVDKLFHDGTAVSAIIGGPSSVVVLCVRNCSAE
ncbi:hypothetical protein R6Q59_016131 [Mikania micrantha]